MATRMRLTKIMSKLGRGRSPKKPTEPLHLRKWDIVRGDRVQVIGDHAEAGKQGVVTKVLRKLDRVIVEGVNVAPKTIKGNPERGIKGRTVQKERTIPYSMVNLVDPVTNKPTRIYKKIIDGEKVRVSKRSGAVIPRPDVLNFRRRPHSNIVCSVSDTANESDVWEITYVPQPPKDEDSDRMEE